MLRNNVCSIEAVLNNNSGTARKGTCNTGNTGLVSGDHILYRTGKNRHIFDGGGPGNQTADRTESHVGIGSIDTHIKIDIFECYILNGGIFDPREQSPAVCRRGNGYRIGSRMHSGNYVSLSVKGSLKVNLVCIGHRGNSDGNPFLRGQINICREDIIPIHGVGSVPSDQAQLVRRIDFDGRGTKRNQTAEHGAERQNHAERDQKRQQFQTLFHKYPLFFEYFISIHNSRCENLPQCLYRKLSDGKEPRRHSCDPSWGQSGSEFCHPHGQNNLPSEKRV